MSKVYVCVYVMSNKGRVEKKVSPERSERMNRVFKPG